MAMRNVLDSLQTALSELLEDKTAAELLEWLHEQGLPNDIDAGVHIALGGLCGLLVRKGCPPATVGAYIAAMMKISESELQ